MHCSLGHEPNQYRPEVHPGLDCHLSPAGHSDNIDSLSEIEPTNSTEPRVIAQFRDTHDFSAPPALNEEE